MIRADQLQIGDYVLISGTPRRVESITKKKIGYYINPQTDKRLYYARLHDVEPIEITEVFLFNNGFKVNKQYPIYEWKEHLYGYMGQTLSVTSPIILQFEPKLKFWGIDNPHDGREYRGDFEYIHQLQQACRMCGIKMEWKV